MYYLGIDCGGTKTTGVLAQDSGRAIRAHKGSPANISAIGKKKFRERMQVFLNALVMDINLADIEWTTIGVAGAGRTKEKNTVKEVLSELGVGKFTVLSDAELLYNVIHADQEGLLLISGTGSVCLRKDATGQFVQYGGWGYLLGDEGSGFDIGKQAVRNAFAEAEKGQRHSTLTDALLSFYKTDDLDGLHTAVYTSGTPQRKIASAARIVCEQAILGEPPAIRIVQRAAAALVQLVRSSVEGMGIAPPYPIALHGGVLSGDSIVREYFKSSAHEARLDLKFVHNNIHPAASGVLQAIEKAGKTASEHLHKGLLEINARFDGFQPSL